MENSNMQKYACNIWIGMPVSLRIDCKVRSYKWANVNILWEWPTTTTFSLNKKHIQQKMRNMHASDNIQAFILSEIEPHGQSGIHPSRIYETRKYIHRLIEKARKEHTFVLWLVAGGWWLMADGWWCSVPGHETKLCSLSATISANAWWTENIV